MIQANRPAIRFKILINILLVALLLIFYFTHYIEGTYSFVIPLGISMIWMIQSIFIKDLSKVLCNNVAIWWWAYLFLCFMMVILGFSTTNINFIISRLPMFIIPGIGYFVVHNYNWREERLLLLFFVIVFGANLIYNIFIGFAIPEIFEEQESTELSIQYGVMMNLAGYGFINVCLWLLGSILMAILVSKKKGMRFVCILLATPIAYYMLMQNVRGTAILLLLVEIIGFVLAYFEPNNKKKFIYYLSLVFLIIVLVFVFFIPAVSYLLENVIQSERLSMRFNDLIDLRQSSGNVDAVGEGSFSQRIVLAQTSLESFFSSPLSIIIGIGDHSVSFGGDLVKSGIGNHSEFIDVLARYGLLGFFVFLNIIKSYRRMLKQVAGSRNIDKYVSIIFVVFILMGFLNPVFEPIQLLFLFIIFPVITDLVKVSIIKN